MAELLVVDDDEIACRVVALLLEGHGHHAVCRRNGRDALEFLRGHNPDLVLLDLMMPDMDGLELLRTVRDEGRLQDLRVVMYTAISDPVTQRQARELGALDYLVKGRDWDEIYPQIARHIH